MENQNEKVKVSETEQKVDKTTQVNCDSFKLKTRKKKMGKLSFKKIPRLIQKYYFSLNEADTKSIIIGYDEDFRVNILYKHNNYDYVRLSPVDFCIHGSEMLEIENRFLESKKSVDTTDTKSDEAKPPTPPPPPPGTDENYDSDFPDSLNTDSNGDNNHTKDTVFESENISLFMVTDNRKKEKLLEFVEKESKNKVRWELSEFLEFSKSFDLLSSIGHVYKKNRFDIEDQFNYYIFLCKKHKVNRLAPESVYFLGCSEMTQYETSKLFHEIGAIFGDKVDKSLSFPIQKFGFV